MENDAKYACSDCQNKVPEGKFYVCTNCQSLAYYCSNRCWLKHQNIHIKECNASNTGHCISECVLHSFVTDPPWLKKIPNLADAHLCRVDVFWFQILEFLISRVRKVEDVTLMFATLVQKGLNVHSRRYAFEIAQKQQSIHWMRLLMHHGQFSLACFKPTDPSLVEIIEEMPIKTLKSTPQSRQTDVFAVKTLLCKGRCSLFHQLLASNARKYHDRKTPESEISSKAAIRFYHALYQRCGLDMDELDPFSFHSDDCNPDVCQSPIDSIQKRSSLLPLACAYHALKQAQNYLIGLVATSSQPLETSFPKVLVNVIHSYVYNKERELARQRIVYLRPRDFWLPEWWDMLTFIASVTTFEPPQKRSRLT